MNPLRARRGQRGMVLIAVLVVLVVTLLAGMSVMRSVQTSNSMSGNFAFRQAAVQATDRAVEEGMTTVLSRVGDANTDVPNRYFAVIDNTVNALGVPTAVRWDGPNAVPCADEKGAIVDCAADTGGYRVQYVVQRRCSRNPNLADVTQIRAYCEYDPRADATSPDRMKVHYRVLIRVRGPRGTENWFEAMLAGPAVPAAAGP